VDAAELAELEAIMRAIETMIAAGATVVLTNGVTLREDSK
jgi:hypothetical protein